MIFSEHSTLLVAVDLSSQGFGYAVFDGPSNLVDWGTRQVTGDKDADCLIKVNSLLEWYGPRTLVLEDCQAKGCQKRERIRALSLVVARMAKALNVEPVHVSWQVVRGVCGRSPRVNKETIAANIATRFPELKRHLPRPRRPWMSEDARMNMLDAVALGVTAQLLADLKRRAA